MISINGMHTYTYNTYTIYTCNIHDTYNICTHIKHTYILYIHNTQTHTCNTNLHIHIIYTIHTNVTYT